MKVPINAFQLKLEFPLPAIPSEDRDLGHVLASWALTPFLVQSEGHSEIVAKYLARALCERCFGPTKLYEERDRPIYWP